MCTLPLVSQKLFGIQINSMVVRLNSKNFFIEFNLLGGFFSVITDAPLLDTHIYELIVTGDYSGSSEFGSYAGNIAISPIPEPETYAMLLVGLGLIGFAARRRKHNFN